MKALTLTQPWASCVALGVKKVETRSWRTNYTGPLAIHAAKGFPKSAQEFAFEPPISVIFGPHYVYPLGKILCVVNLLGCRRTEDVRDQLPPWELRLGDYSDGRHAWFFDGVQLVPEQPTVKGSLGLWDWDPPG